MKKDIVLSTAVILCSVAVIVLAVVHLMGIWDNAIYIFEPLLGIVMLLQAAVNWNKNKIVAGFNLVVGIFVLIVTGFIIAVR